MKSPAKKLTAELFMHGDSQAARLPDEFRFEGNAVRVSKIGDKVILEPLETPPSDVKAWRARLDAYSTSHCRTSKKTRRSPLTAVSRSTEARQCFSLTRTSSSRS